MSVGWPPLYNCQVRIKPITTSGLQVSITDKKLKKSPSQRGVCLDGRKQYLLETSVTVF